jgi:hypothetical protein
MFRQSANVIVVGVVKWWGFDLDDVVDDDGLLENSWIAERSVHGSHEGSARLTIDINRQDSRSVISQQSSKWSTNNF